VNVTLGVGGLVTVGPRGHGPGVGNLRTGEAQHALDAGGEELGLGQAGALPPPGLRVGGAEGAPDGDAGLAPFGGVTLAAGAERHQLDRSAVGQTRRGEHSGGGEEPFAGVRDPLGEVVIARGDRIVGRRGGVALRGSGLAKHGERCGLAR
jgi:hypothetical protein